MALLGHHTKRVRFKDRSLKYLRFLEILEMLALKCSIRIRF